MNQNRYIRQHQLKGFGPEAQQQLSGSRVLVVGMGGLGLPVVQYLNAMGIGTLGLVDQDSIELHNLQRQVLYTEDDIGKPKLEAVLQKLEKQNSETVFKPYDTFLTKDNALGIIKNFDVVVDATDNFATRYLINDACAILKKPFVYGALHGFEGQVSVFNYNDGPTYRCLFPDMPKPHEIPDCNENGVLGIIPGIIGSFQALETVKVLTGIGSVLSGKLLIFDGLTQTSQKINFNSNPENKKMTKLQDSYGLLSCDIVPSVTAEAFLALLESKPDLRLIDVRTPEEYENHHLENAVNIPLDQIDGADDSIAPQNDDVYLICQSGKRSEIALQILQEKHSNSSFYHILGGMNKMKMVCP